MPPFYSNGFKTKAISLSLILAACFAFAGCDSHSSLEGYLNHGYGLDALIKSKSVKMIDDFSTESTTNMIGGKWEIVQRGDLAEIKAAFINEEAVKENDKGKSLLLKFRARQGQNAIWKTDLNMLDVSKAEKVSFWFKGDKKLTKSIDLEIEDTKGGSFKVNIRPYARKSHGDWREFIIPVEKFEGVDFGSLRNLALIFQSNHGETLEGEVRIDHLFFFGKGQVFLESLKDNLYYFPSPKTNSKKELLAKSDYDLLMTIARDTWKYFENTVDKNSALVLDHIKTNWQEEVGDYTSPTNIGLYFLACIAANELGFISREDAVGRITRTMDTLDKLEKWKGFFYNYYNTTNAQVTDSRISTVDNGWLVAALIVVRNAFPEALDKRASKILDAMDFEELYDIGEGQFLVNYDAAKDVYSDSHYGLFCSEARVASLVAIAKGDVEREHWFRMYRTPPKTWTWQNQAPTGYETHYMHINVFEGHYVYKDKKIVPSWGGSLFEFLMPTLVVNEKELGPRALGLNNKIATEIHIDYALNEKGYPIWGLSPCYMNSGTRCIYKEFGIREIGGKGYEDRGVIAPYATFLALDTLPKEAIKNMRKMIELFDVYGEYGFYDSIDVRSKMVAHKYLALDQGMCLIPLANYLKGDCIKRKFHQDKTMRIQDQLFKIEEFSISIPTNSKDNKAETKEYITQMKEEYAEKKEAVIAKRKEDLLAERQAEYLAKKRELAEERKEEIATAKKPPAAAKTAPSVKKEIPVKEKPPIAVKKEETTTEEKVPVAAKTTSSVSVEEKAFNKKDYVIQEGDTLWKIAVKEYGNGNRWRKIYEFNKEKIKNPDNVKPGTTIDIPLD